MSFDDLGTRIKKYEKESEYIIPYSNYIIVRVDGHKFSKFTKGFKKPFDSIIVETMENTAKDLFVEFNAVTAYVQSDEITLVIPPQFSIKHTRTSIDGDGAELVEPKIKNNQILGGRTQKLASLIASFATLKFNKHLEEQIISQNEVLEDFYSNSFRQTNDEREWRNQMGLYKSKIGKAWFDARVFGVPDDIEAFNTVMWRVRDCIKNSKSMFAQAYCSHKSLLNKNGEDQISFCLETTGNDWNTIPDKVKYGVLIKKESFIKVISPNETVKRTKIVSWSEPLTTFSIENVNIITKKLKNEELNKN